MKKLSLWAAFFCLFLASAVFAQKSESSATNFTGNWELDRAKSKLPENLQIESGALNVMHTGKQLTVSTAIKRAARSENQLLAGEIGSGEGFEIGGNERLTYNLGGGETFVESETPAGMAPSMLRLKAAVEPDGKLKLISIRSVGTETRAATIKTVETWEIDKSGVLKITRETETPAGAQTAELYFTRKDLSAAYAKEKPADFSGREFKVSAEDMKNFKGAVVDSSSAMMNSTSVLNSKALKLPAAVYPPAARAVKASGVVLVSITIDEQGNVALANAVAGHPLLRQAAVEAARRAKFAPTLFDGKPVKISGALSYNFAP